MVATEAVKQVNWLNGFVGDLSLQPKLTVVYCDSQSVIHLNKKQMFHERSKHIDVRMFFIRDVIAHGAIVMKKKIPIVDNPENMITKFVFTIKFMYCLNLIGVISIRMPFWGVGAK